MGGTFSACDHLGQEPFPSKIESRAKGLDTTLSRLVLATYA